MIGIAVLLVLQSKGPECNPMRFSAKALERKLAISLPIARDLASVLQVLELCYMPSHLRHL
jgi:hypothetical protein